MKYLINALLITALGLGGMGLMTPAMAQEGQGMRPMQGMGMGMGMKHGRQHGPSWKDTLSDSQKKQIAKLKLEYKKQVYPVKAKVKQAKTDIAAVRSAVTLYLMDEASGCPTVQELAEGKYLAKGKNITDPWDHDYIITCQAGDDPEVYSSGPDGQEGTEDDVQ